MKIVIISDIHDNLVNLRKCLDWCVKEKIKNLICCGDVTNSETLKFLAENFNDDIYLVRGNIEIYGEEEIKKYRNIKYLGRIGTVELDKKLIGICHEPAYISNVISLFNKIKNNNIPVNNKIVSKISAGKPYLISKVLEKGDCEIIFYGHTHQPFEDRRGNAKAINPGTLGGVFTKASFAVYDTLNKEAELKILELL